MATMLSESEMFRFIDFLEDEIARSHFICGCSKERLEYLYPDMTPEQHADSIANEKAWWIACETVCKALRDSVQSGVSVPTNSSDKMLGQIPQTNSPCRMEENNEQDKA